MNDDALRQGEAPPEPGLYASPLACHVIPKDQSFGAGCNERDFVGDYDVAEVT
jgi:hypothetical protein